MGARFLQTKTASRGCRFLLLKMKPSTKVRAANAQQVAREKCRRRTASLSSQGRGETRSLSGVDVDFVLADEGGEVHETAAFPRRRGCAEHFAPPPPSASVEHFERCHSAVREQHTAMYFHSQKRRRVFLETTSTVFFACKTEHRVFSAIAGTIFFASKKVSGVLDSLPARTATPTASTRAIAPRGMRRRCDTARCRCDGRAARTRGRCPYERRRGVR